MRAWTPLLLVAGVALLVVTWPRARPAARPPTAPLRPAPAVRAAPVVPPPAAAALPAAPAPAPMTPPPEAVTVRAAPAEEPKFNLFSGDPVATAGLKNTGNHTVESALETLVWAAVHAKAENLHGMMSIATSPTTAWGLPIPSASAAPPHDEAFRSSMVAVIIESARTATSLRVGERFFTGRDRLVFRVHFTHDNGGSSSQIFALAITPDGWNRYMAPTPGPTRLDPAAALGVGR